MTKEATKEYIVSNQEFTSAVNVTEESSTNEERKRTVAIVLIVVYVLMGLFFAAPRLLSSESRELIANENLAQSELKSYIMEDPSVKNIYMYSSEGFMEIRVNTNEIDKLNRVYFEDIEDEELLSKVMTANALEDEMLRTVKPSVYFLIISFFMFTIAILVLYIN